MKMDVDSDGRPDNPTLQVQYQRDAQAAWNGGIAYATPGANGAVVPCSVRGQVGTIEEVPTIAQLILIPRSDFSGQLVFVISIAISWAYNLWLSFHDEARVEEAIFKEILGTPRLRKFAFRNHTSAVAFILLILKGDPVFLVVWKKILDIYLPWGPRVWEIWREVIIERLERRESFTFTESLWNRKELTPQEQGLLRGLLQDAEDAVEAYNHLKNPKFLCAS
ncbi:hypothetical protein EDC04DRAFT_110946 [Pisolithus marmoratus]|nr:hypothetical protein EDC04DRAFT_110946 [Pisolithus marmoratus]